MPRVSLWVWPRTCHPHLGEVIDGCVAYVDNPDIDVDGLMEHIKGPDFPTGAYILGNAGIRSAYERGADA